MLAEWIDTDWTCCGERGLVGRPRAPLPAAILELDHGAGSAPNGLAPRAREGKAIRLSAGLGYGREQRLAAEVAMVFDPVTRTFRIAREERERLERQWRAAAFRPAAGVFANVGIGGALARPRISSAVERRLADCSGLLASEDALLWRAAGAAPAPTGAPDAVLFHDDGLPSPMTLTVEATTACNYRCGFCYGRHIARGVMRLPEFLAILNNLPPLAAVEFTGEGEPLLNKGVPEMIRVCKTRGAWVHLTTNGSRMTRARAEMIVDLGVDAVATSMESLDPGRFARLRPGGDLAEVQRAIELLATVRAERGAAIQLLLWVTLLRSSLGEIDAFLDYADRAGFAKVEFQVLNRLAAYRRFYSPELAAELLSEAELRRARDSRGTSSRARRVLDDLLAIHGGRRCDIFMGSTMIYWQGEVTPCRLLKVPQHPSCGNALDTSLARIWEEPGFRAFRFALQHGIVLNACDGCAYVAGA